MGLGQIISHEGAGRYMVRLIYAYRQRVVAKITGLEVEIVDYQSQIAALDAQIAAESDLKKKADLQTQRSIKNLQKIALEKRKAYLENNMPANPTVEAWCMDLTEDLVGNVGTAEIPGETQTVLVRPGYNNRAVYSSARDGQLMPPIAGEPNQVLFNWMLLPGWQRHKPIYRTGTIVADSIDFDADTCSVCLDPAYSSQQSLTAVDGLALSDCGTSNKYETQINDFCGRYPGHPFCTNDTEGSEIKISDGQLAQLQAVNQQINAAHGRQNDKSGFRIGDSWDVMGAGDSGDCEDFALTKMKQLVDSYGWNPKNLKLVSCYTKEGVGHAMLGVRTSNRGLLCLDVNNDAVMESGRLPYRIDSVALTKDSWKSWTRRLEAVSIEYMDCNSLAFADGDRVVVQFTDQRWDRPKVVGFVQDPAACRFGELWISAIHGARVYNIEANAFRAVLYGYDMDVYLYFSSAAAQSGGYGFVFGGYNHWGDQDPVALCNKIFPVNESVAVMPEMPEGRVHACGGSSNGRIFCMGGNSAPGGYDPFFNSNYELELLTSTWSIKTSLPGDLAAVKGFTDGSNPILAGGWVGMNSICDGTVATKTSEVLEYSVSGDSFSSRNPRPHAIVWDGQAYGGGFGFAWGGKPEYQLTDEDHVYLDLVCGYQYDTPAASKLRFDSDAWSMIQQMPGIYDPPIETAGYSWDYQRAGGYYRGDDRVYVHRGPIMSNNRINRYNPASDAWAQISSEYDAASYGDNMRGLMI